MFDIQENKRINDAIDRILPKAIYALDEESLYWNICFKDDSTGIIHGVKVNSIYLSDKDDKQLECFLTKIPLDIKEMLRKNNY